MAELNKNAIKLSHMFDMNIDKVKKLYDIIGLSDLAALTTALNNDDSKTVKSVVSKYQSQLVELPNPKEVQDFYFDQIQVNARNEEEALADTADEFGITGEQVQQMLDAPKVESVESPYIADSYVQAAYDNVQEMLKGGKVKRGVFEALNPWQRRMFYGLVPATVSAVCQKTLDMTPIAIMQKQAEIEGIAEISVQENIASLHEMIENIIQYELNHLSEGMKPNHFNPGDKVIVYRGNDDELRGTIVSFDGDMEYTVKEIDGGEILHHIPEEWLHHDEQGLDGLDEGWKKISPNSQERHNIDNQGKAVKTPDGLGKIIRQMKVPTFSQMVPFSHQIYVQLDSGERKTYPAKQVKIIKEPIDNAEEDRLDFNRDGEVIEGYSDKERTHTANQNNYNCDACQDLGVISGSHGTEEICPSCGGADNNPAMKTKNLIKSIISKNF